MAPTALANTELRVLVVTLAKRYHDETQGKSGSKPIRTKQSTRQDLKWMPKANIGRCSIVPFQWDVEENDRFQAADWKTVISAPFGRTK